MADSARTRPPDISISIRTLPAIVVAAIVACGCSSATTSNAGPTTTSVTTNVDAHGAKIDLPGTASLFVQPGALDTPTTITIAVVDAPTSLPAGALSKVVSFAPHETHFELPAKISIQYDASALLGGISVVGLGDDEGTTWHPVGGASFSTGLATFETNSLGDFAVVAQTCTESTSAPCSSTCECCGTASCVDLRTDPKNCGACGNDCGADGYCDSSSVCAKVATSKLCDNTALMVIGGSLPDLTEISPEQTLDSVHAATLANAIVAACALPSATTTNEATLGILDPCTDEPLQTGGTTDLVVGGTFSQRIARFLDRNGLSPYELVDDPTTKTTAFVTQTGTHVVDFAADRINPSHDYFVIALIPDTTNGALILHVFGVGWEGTPAATWYFPNVVLPAMLDGTRTWRKNLLVEWTDDGDGIQDGKDTYTVLAQDQ